MGAKERSKAMCQKRVRIRSKTFMQHSLYYIISKIKFEV